MSNRPEMFATYDQDFFAWTETQAAALRDIPASDVTRAVDFTHVAEEIEDLGKRELREVKSLLSRVLEHLIKIARDRHGAAASHWRVEALVFQRDAFNAFSPAMRQYLDINDLWLQGCRFAAASRGPDDITVAPPPVSPFALDDLLRDRFDLDPLLDRLFL